MAEPGAPQLRIATIFTSAVNEAENDSNGNIEEDPEGIKGLDSTSRDFWIPALQSTIIALELHTIRVQKCSKTTTRIFPCAPRTRI